MSAGTMIAGACNEVVMGKQSNLGPIDPPFGGLPAHGVIKEFEEAIQAAKDDPGSLPIWRAAVRKYHRTFMGQCRNAVQFANEMSTEWLKTAMFNGAPQATEKAAKVVGYLGDHDNTKTHARHINIDEAIAIGMKIVCMEANQPIQDTVLTVHHAFMHTFANSKAIKITENQIDNVVMVLRGENLSKRFPEFVPQRQPEISQPQGSWNPASN